MLFGMNMRKPAQKQVNITTSPFGEGGVEPKLADLLSDPIIHLIAQADRIKPGELDGSVETMRQRLRRNH
ncbi:hypothetical protein MTBPR1_40116 [Candidatus Terasakiella magnetica]|uniref:Uncharacterized protein n=1 Tax=Candidatus Terasakiella magnetica TaxID=1867952 RepID=A0A1C3RIK6_9PROT|nr:hypothetical protein [Candidatus Terasakiella magnetica]SCA57093.1 hypothetical protein MTBPR1_40116 [Candidatus Terasakiella magnetica]